MMLDGRRFYRGPRARRGRANFARAATANRGWHAPSAPAAMAPRHADSFDLAGVTGSGCRAGIAPQLRENLHMTSNALTRIAAAVGLVAALAAPQAQAALSDALMVGGILAIPVITYQALMFIVPGLTERERRYVLYSIPFVTLLFVVGVVFAWALLIPPAIGFFNNFMPELFVAQWTADRYLGFVTALLFWMGVAFETPLIAFVLSILGILTPMILLKQWRIAIVGAAVAAALITPTVDPVNMMLVMGPLIALYALSIVLTAVGMRFAPDKREVTDS